MITEEDYNDFEPMIATVKLDASDEIFYWYWTVKDVRRIDIDSRTYDFKELLYSKEADDYWAVSHSDLLKYFTAIRLN